MNIHTNPGHTPLGRESAGAAGNGAGGNCDAHNRASFNPTAGEGSQTHVNLSHLQAQCDEAEARYNASRGVSGAARSIEARRRAWIMAKAHLVAASAELQGGV